MNKKVLSLVVLLLGLMVAGKAQDDSRITIKGIITDVSTAEPIPFANLGVIGTLAGVASDMNGEFELILPESYAGKVLRVSVVGYSPYDIKVADAAAVPELKIELQPVTYTIQQVNVNAQSLVYRKMLKQAVENISRNYLMKPYNYQGYFQHQVNSGDARVFSKEAIVMLYDARGYERSDVEKAYKQLRYRYDEVRRSEEPKSVLDGLTYFDDILTADIVRHTRNVLDIANARDYRLSNKGKLMFEGDSVQVIGYEVANPSLSTTGSADVKKYSGEIYINLRDYAILKNVMHISATDYSTLGRNLIPVEEYKKGNTEMTITTNYKKMENRYSLSGITISWHPAESATVKGKMQYVVTRVNAQTPEAIEGRMYYENIKTSPKFWDNYTVIGL